MAIFIFLTRAMWTPSCSIFFNMYCLSSYAAMVLIRKYQNQKIEELETNRRVQLVLVGIMMPLFTLHTYYGAKEFFNADTATCRMEYQGEVIYIINFMFAICMCLVLVFLFLVVLVPGGGASDCLRT